MKEPMAWLRDRFELYRGANENVRTMEGLRGLAVFLVFLVHYAALSSPWLPVHSLTTSVAAGLGTIGHAGVDLFFVLSGYLIYGALISHGQRFTSFMRRRVERIYPTFAAVFLIYIAASIAIPSQRKIPPGAFSAAVYLVQNALLLPGLFPIRPMITVAWSLSYEMFFYLVIPLVVAILALRRRSPAMRAGLFLAAAILVAAYCAAFGGPVALIMFLSGMVLYETVRNRLFDLPGRLLGPLALIAALGSLLVPMSGSAGFAAHIGVLFVCFFVLCHACFTLPAAPLGRVLSLTPIRWLGNMSYSYYLIHGLALKALFYALPKAVPATHSSPALFWLLFLPAVAFTLVPSTVLFLMVERPFSLAPVLERKARVQPVPAPTPAPPIPPVAAGDLVPAPAPAGVSAD